MNRFATFIGGLGLGLAAMYLIDPNQGRSRRAQLRKRVGRRVEAGTDWRLVSGIAGVAAVAIAARLISRQAPERNDSGLPDFVHSTLQEAHLY